ncbi:hypothetical protein NITLEN_60074 [Nitrospira lenta]|uniref:Uncharacterized protein n=1 Tax=Nitrospira lenta TaxID=1436998 RepID=A0A330LGM7_9BACT|nr:hypothetical protein NITLEN_60074 [Nitrospira lenta]
MAMNVNFLLMLANTLMLYNCFFIPFATV